MIEISTKLSPEATKALNKIQFRRLSLFFAIFSLFFILIGVFALLGNEDGDIGFAIYCIVIGVLFMPLVKLFTIPLQKSVNKSMKLINEETTNYFRFDENMIYQETVKGTTFRCITECDYSLLWKAYENKSHFYMYISKMQAHVIPKEDIVVGNAEMLTELFSSKLGKKFKRFGVGK